MKRSGGVTAAAVVLIVGSSLLVLMAGMVGLLPLLPQPANEQNPFGVGFFYFEAVFILAVAGWGIATAVGILRLRNWARISILVISGLAIVMSFFTILMTFLLVPMISQEAKLPPGAASFIELFELIIFGIPLGIAIWWMVLFLLKNVRVQFGAGTQGAIVQSGAAGGMPAVAMPGSLQNTRGKMPVSILVIAVYMVAGAPMSLMMLAIPFMRRMPMVLFGHFFLQGSAWEFLLVTAAIDLVLGIGLLLRAKWAWLGSCIFCGFTMANLVVTELSPHYLDRMLQIMRQAIPEASQSYAEMFGMRMGNYSTLVFGVGLPIVALYFLWTRREAYRTACAAKG